VTDVVKEASNIRIDDPIHLAPANPTSRIRAIQSS